MDIIVHNINNIQYKMSNLNNESGHNFSSAYDNSGILNTVCTKIKAKQKTWFEQSWKIHILYTDCSFSSAEGYNAKITIQGRHQIAEQQSNINKLILGIYS